MGRLHDLILDIEKNLSEKGGEVVYTKVIGKKRMAYPIQKQKFGTYVLVQFKSDGSNNNDFNFDMGNNANVLRHMVITIDESEVKKQTEDIIDQISGLSRPTNSSEEKEESAKETTNTDEVVEVSDSKQESNEEPVENETVEEDSSEEETKPAETSEE